MQTHVGQQYGRFVIMHLSKGELILESIQKEVKRLGIQAGIVTSGIGSARKIIYHRIKTVDDNPQDEFLTITTPTEILAIQGVIVDGEPHLHITCADTKEAFGGHLEPGCEVQYLVELSILELLGVDLVRRPDEFGVSQIQLR